MGVWIGGSGFVHDVSLLAFTSERALLSSECLVVDSFLLSSFLLFQFQGVFVKDRVQIGLTRSGILSTCLYPLSVSALW